MSSRNFCGLNKTAGLDKTAGGWFGIEIIDSGWVLNSLGSGHNSHKTAGGWFVILPVANAEELVSAL